MYSIYIYMIINIIVIITIIISPWYSFSTFHSSQYKSCMCFMRPPQYQRIATEAWHCPIHSSKHEEKATTWPSQLSPISEGTSRSLAMVL